MVPLVESEAQGLQAFLVKQHVTETLCGKKKRMEEAIRDLIRHLAGGRHKANNRLSK